MKIAFIDTEFLFETGLQKNRFAKISFNFVENNIQYSKKAVNEMIAVRDGGALFDLKNRICAKKLMGIRIE